jgi:DNA polymerase III subunit delta
VKISGAEAASRLADKPGAELSAVLLYGPDPMLVSVTRQEVVAKLVGPSGEAEMRLERVQVGELRRDGAVLGDTVRAQGFFPGRRVVLLESASDGVADSVLRVLADRQPGDAILVVTAGQLPARSSLRKAFEAHRSAYAVALYPDPPSRGEIEARLGREGIRADAEAVDSLVALATEQDPGAFSRTLEALALFMHGSSAPASAADVAAVAPDVGEGDVDVLINCAAEGNAAAIGLHLKRLAASGTPPTSLAIAASRHFRALHAAASAVDGVEAGLSRLRPPVFGPRRSRMAAQARRLGQPATEKALMLLTEADLALRSSRPVPGLALVERVLIRIAMLAGR